MEIIELDRNRIEEIAPLWEQLREHHALKSSHFQARFESLTFAERVSTLQMKEKLTIFVARDEAGSNIGYCIASIWHHGGEIDSLFVIPACQKSAVGRHLMEAALAWLRKSDCQRVTISVAEGNEETFPFYAKFGFKPRLQVLEMQTGR